MSNTLITEDQEEKHLIHYIRSLWYYWYQSRIWVYVFSPGLIKQQNIPLILKLD